MIMITDTIFFLKIFNGEKNAKPFQCILVTHSLLEELCELRCEYPLFVYASRT